MPVMASPGPEGENREEVEKPEKVLQVVRDAKLERLNEGVLVQHEQGNITDTQLLLSFGATHEPSWAPLAFVEKSIGAHDTALLLAEFFDASVARCNSLTRQRFLLRRACIATNHTLTHAHVCDVRMSRAGVFFATIAHEDGTFEAVPSGQLLNEATGDGARLYAEAIEHKLIAAAPPPTPAHSPGYGTPDTAFQLTPSAQH